MTIRIIGIFVILVAILFLPYWVYVPLLFVGIVFYPFFWEAVLFALLVEELYGNSVGFFASLISPLALASVLFIIIILPFRENLRSYV